MSEAISEVSVFLLSIQAIKQDEIRVTENQIQRVATMRHTPTMITADSIDEAKQIGNEIAQKTFPQEDGWEHDVIVVEATLEVRATAEMRDGIIDMDISIKPLSGKYAKE